MKEYYIHRDGKNLGPFSLEDLQGQEMNRDTLIWRANTGTAVPAHQLAELDPLFKKEQPGPIQQNSSGNSDSLQAKSSGNTKSPAAVRTGLRLGIIILLALAIGAAIYFMVGKSPAESKQDDVTSVHEQEVQKAIQELNAEKLAKKTAEQRRELLKERKAELRSLNAQLDKAMKRKAEALAEVDKIRRPHLFRSRSKKEAQLAEQLEIIDRMDGKAANLRSRIVSAQAAVDTLSAGLSP